MLHMSYFYVIFKMVLRIRYIFKGQIFRRVVLYMKIGIIRVLSINDDNELNHHGRIIERITNFQCITRCIENQPYGIYDEKTEKEAIPKIVNLAKRMEKKDKVSVIIISCAADPGLKQVRNELSIPVIGAGESGALVARALSRHIGVLTITDDIPNRMKTILGSNVQMAKPKNVTNVIDLYDPNNSNNLLSAVEDLLERGSEVIVFACTGFSTMGYRQKLIDSMGIRIVDSVEAAGVLASYFIKHN